jgi:succinate dehydrogenase / fumarate reductase, cytochrome b subunit
MKAAGGRLPRPPAPHRSRWRGAGGWFDVRHRGLGGWAFALNRLTGIGLVGYLYLHLGVLSLLARGPGGWDRFVELAHHPFFLWLDVVLVVGLLAHGLNGVRAALVGTGLVMSRHQALFVALMLLGALVAIVAAVLILT